MRRKVKQRGGWGARLGLVLAAGVLVALVFSTYWFLFRSTPEQVVRTYLQALEAGNYATMKTLSTAAAAAKLPAQNTPPPAGEALPALQIGRASLQGALATVPIKETQTTLLGPRTATVNAVLHRENGRWLVDQMVESDPPGGELAP